MVDSVHQDEVQQDVLGPGGLTGEQRVGAAAGAASQPGAVWVEELAGGEGGEGGDLSEGNHRQLRTAGGRHRHQVPPGLSWNSS